jgi:hypothetical protein
MYIRIIISTLLTLLTALAFGQNLEYNNAVKTAFEMYEAKQYKESALAYSKAFAALGGKAAPDDRYNAACSWALAGNKDSALYHLQYLADKAKYNNYKHLLEDTDLSNLHADKRWKPLCNQVKLNKEKAEANLNKPLLARLEDILDKDQKYRRQVEPITEKYGRDSKELKELWKTITFYDSVNQIEVLAILEKYGWPTKEMVGEWGAQAVFLVIQHAETEVQDKYLPVMREAVKKGNARASSLALLEDRVALAHGGKQTYGSQVGSDEQGMYLLPLLDPDNVDDRRLSVGLGPLAGYLRGFGMKWDVEEYKKQLPEIEKRAAARH